jgi:hypothetical protein
MTCSECQLQIFDGELDRDGAVHLAVCEDCRVLDREVRLNASALAAMREDVLPVRRARRWPWMVAAAAAVVLAVVGLSDRPAPVVVLPQVAMVPAPVAPVVASPVKPKPARRARVAKAAPPAEPLLVKFLTDDPDVVIYWLIDPVQGEQAL